MKRYKGHRLRARDVETGFSPGCIPKFTTLEKFIGAKIQMLERDFYITPTPEEIEKLKRMRTESDVNAAVKTIINRHWGRED